MGRSGSLLIVLKQLQRQIKLQRGRRRVTIEQQMAAFPRLELGWFSFKDLEKKMEFTAVAGVWEGADI